MARLIFIIFFTLLLAACQAAPATESTEAATPTETVLPTPTATQTLLPTLIPNPTVSPAELNRRAGPICENAFSTLVETGQLEPPFAVMKKATYADDPAWELAHQLPHLGTLAAADVRTLFCISETRAQAGTYTDGSAAYQLFWEVRAVSWPGGRVIGKNSFIGSSPPEINIFAASSAEGPFPYPQFAAWVFSKVDHPDFIHFNDAVTTMAVSPSGSLSAFGTSMTNEIVDRDYQARIFFFRTSNMQIISAVDGHRGMVTSLAFSPDGKVLASSGFDLFVKFWDVSSGHLLGQVNIADTPNSVTFSPDGTKLAVASNLDVAFIDMHSMKATHSLQEASGKDVVYSPDGDFVFVNSLGSIKVIDPNANMVMLTFPEPFALVPTLSVSADGTVTGVTYETPETVDGSALSPDGTQIATYTIAQSPDGSTGTENVRLARWDAKTGKYIDEIKFSGDEIGTISFSPDGNQLALGNANEVWIWETKSWQLKERLTGHIGVIADLAFTPDGSKILSAGSDGTIRVWTLEQ